MFSTLKKIFMGNIISQVIGLITVPLIAYYYSPQEVGFYGTFFSISACLAVILSFRIENLFFSLSVLESKYLRNFSIKIIFLISLFILILTNLFVPLGKYSSLINLSFFGGVTIGVFNNQYNYLVRSGETDRYVRMKTLRGICELIAVLVCTIAHFKISILCFLISLGYILVIFNGKIYSGEGEKDWQIGFKLFSENRYFIINDLFASVFNVIYIYLPTIYFYFNNNQDISGVFFTVARVIGVPTLMIAQSIGTTLKQYAVIEYVEKKTVHNSISFILDKIIIKPFMIYILLILVTLIFSYFIEPYYNKNVFYITIIMVPLFFTRYIYNCFSSIIYVLKMQRYNLYFQIFLLGISSFALFSIDHPNKSLLFYSISSILVYIGFIYFIFKIKKVATKPIEDIQ